MDRESNDILCIKRGYFFVLYTNTVNILEVKSEDEHATEIVHKKPLLREHWK
jgi:hypothetical protein